MSEPTREADPGDMRVGDGGTQSSMSIKVYKTRPGGELQLVSARIVGPREELTPDCGTEFPPCTCPRCEANAATAAS